MPEIVGLISCSTFFANCHINSTTLRTSIIELHLIPTSGFARERVCRKMFIPRGVSEQLGAPFPSDFPIWSHSLISTWFLVHDFPNMFRGGLITWGCRIVLPLWIHFQNRILISGFDSNKGAFVASILLKDLTGVAFAIFSPLLLNHDDRLTIPFQLQWRRNHKICPAAGGSQYCGNGAT